jgi:hypothetical protein
MKRGIFRHGGFKTFLTRGILKGVFEPILYSDNDRIHRDFVIPLNECARVLPTFNVVRRATNLLTYWLVQVPKELFETLFIPGEKGRSYFSVVSFADHNGGQYCAHLTQAYVVFLVEQSLRNSLEFATTMGFTQEDMRLCIEGVYGKQNLTVQCLVSLYEEFGLQRMKVDPRDWPIVYLWKVCDALIHDKRRLKECMGAWNDDPFQRSAFSAWAVEFIIDRKNASLRYAAQLEAEGL